MAGKTFQLVIDLLAELNAGRPGTFVVASEDAAERVRQEVERRVAPEHRHLLTVIVRPLSNAGEDR